MLINPISIYDLSSTKVLNKAYDSTCPKRLNHSHNNIRFKWEHLLPQLQEELNHDCFQLSHLQSYFIDEQNLSSWHAMDAIVFKSDIHGNSKSI